VTGPRNESGSGTVLGLAVAGCVVTAVAVMIPLYMGLSQREALEGAADATALAGADVASGISPGSPCEVAGRVAGSDGAAMTSCVVDGLVVTVRVERDYLGLQLTESASAGPSETVTN
jgi:secretion/DNA translocation related TadE-like protein